MNNVAPVLKIPTIDRVHARSSSSSSSRSRSSSNGNEEGTTYYYSSHLGEVYALYMGRPATPGLCMQLDHWAAEIHEDVVEYAIMEASLAPRPSWAYIEAILRKCRGMTYTQIPGMTIKENVELYRSRIEGR